MDFEDTLLPGSCMQAASMIKQLPLTVAHPWPPIANFEHGQRLTACANKVQALSRKLGTPPASGAEAGTGAGTGCQLVQRFELLLGRLQVAAGDSARRCCCLECAWQLHQKVWESDVQVLCALCAQIS